MGREAKEEHCYLVDNPLHSSKHYKPDMSEFNPNDYKEYDAFIVSEIEEGFRHVQINYPKTLNSFNEVRWRQFQAVLEKLDRDPTTVVVLISSTSPKSFSSGLDLKDAFDSIGNLSDVSNEERYIGVHEHIEDFQIAVATPSRMKVPTIALLNGINYGLALDIASACSIRIAVEGCKFSIKEIQIGITADMGSLQRLPAIVNNQSLLYERALTGSIFSAQDALSWGLVSQVFPTFEAGLKYCKDLGTQISGYPNWAVRGTKKCINEINLGLSVDQGLKNVAAYNATHLDGNFLKAVSGFNKKSKL